MGLHIRIAFEQTRMPRPYMWQPMHVIPAYPIHFVQQPAIFRPPMTYPVMQFYSEPYHRPQQRNMASFGEFAGGVGLLAATARYGPLGFFGALAAMAIGKTVINNLETNNSPAAAAPAVSAPPTGVRTSAAPPQGVDMSNLAINGLDADGTATVVADASGLKEDPIQRRRNLDSGYGFG
jgi:hypothetical protein